MKITRLYAFALAALSFAIAIGLYEKYLMWLGFRDGFVAELDAAQATLATYFIWFSMATGVYFIGVGFLPARINAKKPLLYACLLFALAASVTIAVDQYFRTTMVDSAGG